MFSGASTFVEGVDTTFGVIMGITLFLLIGISLTIILFMYRYNKRRHPKAVQIKGYPTLELMDYYSSWTRSYNLLLWLDGMGFNAGNTR